MKLLDFGISRAAGLEAEFRLTQHRRRARHAVLHVARAGARRQRGRRPRRHLRARRDPLRDARRARSRSPARTTTSSSTGDDRRVRAAARSRPDVPEPLEQIIAAGDGARRRRSGSRAPGARAGAARVLPGDVPRQRDPARSQAGIPWNTPLPLPRPQFRVRIGSGAGSASARAERARARARARSGGARHRSDAHGAVVPTPIAPSLLTGPAPAQRSKLPLVMGASVLAVGAAAGFAFVQSRSTSPGTSPSPSPSPSPMSGPSRGAFGVRRDVEPASLRRRRCPPRR